MLYSLDIVARSDNSTMLDNIEIKVSDKLGGRIHAAAHEVYRES